MANPEHVKMVKQGAEVLNNWLYENKFLILHLNNTELQGINLCGAHLEGAFLWGTHLEEANLRGAHLEDANLRGAILERTILSKANLDRALLESANLMGAILDDASIRDTNFLRTNLFDASLRRAKLKLSDFTNAYCGNTNFGDVDLSEVIGLDSVIHQYPSTIGIDTIYKSKGKIPKRFLKGAGVPDNLITYIDSLTGRAFEFYSCFISYTEDDDIFSKCLYQDLQDKGIRVWRWREDAKWGEILIGQVDKAVKVYDKLIVICSEKALKSPAVLREIERALQKEDDLTRKSITKSVLFPIRLDDYVLDGWEHPRKPDVVAKVIGDFREWKNKEQYKRSLDRLMKALRSDEKN